MAKKGGGIGSNYPYICQAPSADFDMDGAERPKIRAKSILPSKSSGFSETEGQSFKIRAVSKLIQKIQVYNL